MIRTVFVALKCFHLFNYLIYYEYIDQIIHKTTKSIAEANRFN